VYQGKRPSYDHMRQPRNPEQQLLALINERPFTTTELMSRTKHGRGTVLRLLAALRNDGKITKTGWQWLKAETNPH
jgi:predicted Rossmann fold nucleotide-binding protein DprA/Smf involved in DNA uptake